MIDLTQLSGPGGRDGLVINSSSDNSVSTILTNKPTFDFYNSTDQVKANLSANEGVFNGSLTSQCLTITGGCDITEPFEISEGQLLPAGSVVVIDEAHPGKLTPSAQRYDRRVAGIISGAGEVRTGLTLSQEGLMDNGQQVALAGRVYVRASAENGPIRPGDMLTTASLPGRAMKATDPLQAFGSVIGKAMSGLDAGEGLVLVLVGLQ